MRAEMAEAMTLLRTLTNGGATVPYATGIALRIWTEEVVEAAAKRVWPTLYRVRG